MAPLPLAHLRVVDQCDEKAELCGRLLADLGADVLRVEPAGGARSRRIGPFEGEESLYFAVRNANKRTVEVDVATATGRNELLTLLAGADLWIESSAPGRLGELGLDPDEVARRFPQLVVVSVSDFGLTGPYRDFVGTDPVLVALSWMLFRAGVPERPPVLPPGALAYDVAGITAAFAALTGFLHRCRTGRGQRIDLSVMEAVAQTTDWGLASYSVMERLGGEMSQIRSGGGQIYPIVPCRDGWVRPSMVSTAEWRKMRAWLGEPPELQVDELDLTGPRVAIYDRVIRPLLVDLFAEMTMIEAAEEGQRRRIPITPLLRPADVLAAPHYRELRTFVEGEAAPGVTGPIAGGFFLVDGERVGFRAAAAPADEPGWLSPERLAPAFTGGSLPYEGMLVLDFGVAGAAPEIGRLLAEYGLP